MFYTHLLQIKNLVSLMETQGDLTGNSLSIYVNTWRRKWQPTPVFLPGESHGQRSLVSQT